MAGSSGYTVAFGAKTQGLDEAFAKINKDFDRTAKAVAKLNRENKQVGDTPGLPKLAIDMKQLGLASVDVFRGLDRVVPQILTLTSATTLAGMAELSKRWAEAGSQIQKTAYTLRTPTAQLSELQNAARIAGSSASVLDQSMVNLDDHLRNAVFGKDKAAKETFVQMGIAITGVDGRARSAADALGDVADAIKRQRDAGAQVNLLSRLGISPDLLPLLKDGREGLEKFLKAARQSGGTVTDEMARSATELKRSFVELQLTLEGVTNRMANDWSSAMTKMMRATAEFIQKNEELQRALLTLNPLNPSGTSELIADWIKRKLGLSGGPSVDRMALPRRFWNWINTEEPGAGGGTSAPGGGSGARGLPGPRSGAPNGTQAQRGRTIHDALLGSGIPGMTDNLAWGLAARALLESDGDPRHTPGDGGESHGLMQWRNSGPDHRLDRVIGLLGHLPEQGDLGEAVRAIGYELTGPERDAWNRMRAAGSSAGDAGEAASRYYIRPGNTQEARDMEAARTRALADQLAGMGGGGVPAGMTPTSGGAVNVNIRMTGAPSGTTVSTTSTGTVIAPPARVEYDGFGLSGGGG